MKYLDEYLCLLKVSWPPEISAVGFWRLPACEPLLGVASLTCASSYAPRDFLPPNYLSFDIAPAVAHHLPLHIQIRKGSTGEEDKRFRYLMGRNYPRSIFCFRFLGWFYIGASILFLGVSLLINTFRYVLLHVEGGGPRGRAEIERVGGAPQGRVGRLAERKLLIRRAIVTNVGGEGVSLVEVSVSG